MIVAGGDMTISLAAMTLCPAVNAKPLINVSDVSLGKLDVSGDANGELNKGDPALNPPSVRGVRVDNVRGVSVAARGD